MKYCWICGQEANSKEHIIKKTDLTRVYGNGPYKGNNELAHIKNGKQQLIQGPNSKKLKYENSLCHHCNTTLTQPFDLSYEVFADYIYKNEEKILRKRFIDFSEDYGLPFEEGQRNLYKYLAKSFGCRLHDAGAEVPPDIKSLFEKESFKTGLRINFSVNEDVLILPKKDRDGFLGKGDLIVWLNKDDKKTVNGYTWNEHISWLFFSYWYLINPDGNCGSVWVADNQYVYLGCQEPLDGKMRAELKRKVESKA